MRMSKTLLMTTLVLLAGCSGVSDTSVMQARDQAISAAQDAEAAAQRAAQSAQAAEMASQSADRSFRQSQKK